jgi:hypothetical protein
MNGDISHNIKTRLLLSGISVLILLFLSGLTFYYFHIKAPYIPLIIVLIGAVPMGIIVDELRRLLKVKHAQQSHYPPKRSRN